MLRLLHRISGTSSRSVGDVGADAAIGRAKASPWRLIGRRTFLRSASAATVGLSVLGSNIALKTKSAEASSAKCTWCKVSDSWYCYWYGYCQEFYPYCDTIYVYFDCYSCCQAGCCYTSCGCDACICQDGPYYVCSSSAGSCPFGDNFPCDGCYYDGCCGTCQCYQQGKQYATALSKTTLQRAKGTTPSSPPANQP